MSYETVPLILYSLAASMFGALAFVYWRDQKAEQVKAHVPRQGRPIFALRPPSNRILPGRISAAR